MNAPMATRYARPRAAHRRRRAVPLRPLWYRWLRWAFGVGGGVPALTLLLTLVMLVRWRVRSAETFDALLQRLF